MVATPKITTTYWDAANAMELRFINENIAPDVPPDIEHDLDMQGIGAETVDWVAKRLLRNALPGNAHAILWQMPDQPCEACNGKGDIQAIGKKAVTEVTCASCNGLGYLESTGLGFYTDIDGNLADELND